MPVSDGAHGGGHPGYNPKVAENAKVVRELAREHKAWFVDVFGLYLALDPPFRGVVGDGIHPDTDGSTCIVNGLRWVFEQMGLMDARPHLKGWALTGPPAPLHDLLKSGVRPFRISQPDHPDPDHQSEAGFTLEAIRRNDEYGLIASRDGASLAVGQGLLFRCGLSRADGPQSVVLRLAGKGLTAAQVWGRGIAELANSAIGSSASRSRKPAEDRARAEAGGWGSIPLKEADGWLCGRIPLSAVEEGLFHVLVLGGKDAALDALAVDVEGAEPPALWKPREVAPSEYVLASDHLRSDNLLKNADFAAGDAEHWRLSGAARINRPFKAAVEGVSFVDEKDLRMAELATSAAVRPFDVIEMSGSAKGNDGPYRVRDEMGNGRWRMRKKAKAVESGLKGELRHNDGCGLVAGDCCVEVSGEGMASQRAKLPPSTRAVRLSFFYRVYDPKALGTRDVPPPCAKVKALFLDVNGRQAGSEWLVTDLPCSYQWQKAELERDAPNGAASVELTVQSASATVVQYTGFFAGRASRE
ncbi:MAG: hypothetical protein FJ279_22155 [Planctomycetes bacterium]|nr:hypothetical protein [Planctomycetota bacterium]